MSYFDSLFGGQMNNQQLGQLWDRRSHASPWASHPSLAQPQPFGQPPAGAPGMSAPMGIAPHQMGGDHQMAQALVGNQAAPYHAAPHPFQPKSAGYQMPANNNWNQTGGSSNQTIMDAISGNQPTKPLPSIPPPPNMNSQNLSGSSNQAIMDAISGPQRSQQPSYMTMPPPPNAGLQYQLPQAGAGATLASPNGIMAPPPQPGKPAPQNLGRRTTY